ncbi:YqaJ viral recombinase family protein [Streptomyces uncialis]|uniref:YqaJ viral recombinase family nuclease n=1 Tax=Streptomyces uncialis TaxID=1048205 RepID=UPI003660525C
MTPPAPGGVPAAARLLLPADSSEAAWLAARQAGLGGSDIAAILGLSRYRSPWHVWREKQGLSDFRDSEAAECGRELEAAIGRLFSRRSGRPVTSVPGTLQNIERPWMLANIDCLAIEADGSEAPVECKNRSEYQLDDWLEDEAPDDPALQCLWYVAVGGYRHGYVAGLIGGNKLKWFRLERDEDLIAHLIEFCGDWWQRHVVDGVQPDPDGSKATTELLKHLWDAEDGVIAVADPGEVAILKARRAELKEAVKATEKDINTIENRLRVIAGEAALVTDAAGRALFTLKANGTFAPTRFRNEHPDLAAQYVRQVDALDTKALAADHPETHGKYRARVLRFPAAPKGK